MIRTVIILSAILTLTACSSDDEPRQQQEEDQPRFPTLPYSSLTLTELLTSDAQPVTLTQTFETTEGRLTGYTARQSVQASDEVVLLESVTTLAYTDSTATATDSRGNVYRYSLNGRGYATRCLLNEGSEEQRTYTYDYLVNSEEQHYLRTLCEYLADGTLHTRIEIEWPGYRQMTVSHQVGSMLQNHRLTTPPDHETANLAQLPCPLLADLHPLSSQLPALYGKLLGEPPQVLIQEVTTDNGTPQTWQYTTDSEGWPTACTTTVTSGSHTYTHTVQYTFKTTQP